MEQELTKEQFREIVELGYYGRKRLADLIEFLGEDLLGIHSGWWVLIDGYYEDFESKELCDALFDAVKYKLKQ